MISAQQKRKLKFNTVFPLIYQALLILCGLILPRLYLTFYGSDTNGLVHSIAQFIGIISFCDLGVSVVVQSALYKPLAINDKKAINEIISSATNFFRRVALIFTVYIVILIVVYPYFVKNSYSSWDTRFLIAILSISTFSQYFFGIVDGLLLQADQRGYVQTIAQTITLVANTILSVVLIEMRMDIAVVKLVSSIIFLARPICLRLYVVKHYSLDRKVHYLKEPITQKWNGLAQHLASIVLENTDTIVLTIFSVLSNVSIYSVYNLVIYGVKQLFTSTSNGIKPLLGECYARNEKEKLKEIFDWSEWLIHTGTVFLFGCTAMLVVPFVMVYTKGVTDANYYVPLFALLLTVAHGVHCLRLPYNIMILASNEFKRTQNNYYIAMILNITISILTVKMFGLVGVAIGTIIAMTYQVGYMAIFNANVIFKSKNYIIQFMKQLLVDVCTFTLAYFVSKRIELNSLDYFSWIVLAVKTTITWLGIILFINYLFYRKQEIKLLKKVFKR